MSNYTKTFYKQAFIAANATMQDALLIIERHSAKLAIIVGANDILLGVLTDGDIRRGFINGLQPSDGVSSIMRQEPMTISEQEAIDKDYVISLMLQHDIQQIPVINVYKQVVDIKIYKDLIKKTQHDNWVVLMAGGQGQRLRPLTDKLPKPMLEIDGKPILEHIIQKFQAEGFHKFYISVNYKATIIKDYFGDGTTRNITVKYLEEDKPLDTAGSLGLIDADIDHPIIVMNGDILAKVNIENMLKFHHEQEAVATMGVRNYTIQIPYGVVESHNEFFDSIKEKPIYNYFVNAGIYILNPEVLSKIPSHESLKMTELFQQLKECDDSCSVYPIYEYWLDIGELANFKRAKGEFRQIFNG